MGQSNNHGNPRSAPRTLTVNFLEALTLPTIQLVVKDACLGKDSA